MRTFVLGAIRRNEQNEENERKILLKMKSSKYFHLYTRRREIIFNWILSNFDKNCGSSSCKVSA